MVWNYRSAIRQGNTVNAILEEPPSGRIEALNFTKYPHETEAAFVARGQELIRSNLAGLEARRTQETDVTNIFRPPAG